MTTPIFTALTSQIADLTELHRFHRTWADNATGPGDFYHYNELADESLARLAALRECRDDEKLEAMERDMSCLDHNHESATNWLHTLRTSLALTPSPRDIAAAHDRLMEIQDKQGALVQRILNEQQKPSVASVDFNLNS